MAEAAIDPRCEEQEELHAEDSEGACPAWSLAELAAGGTGTKWPSPLGRVSGPEPRGLRFRFQSQPVRQSWVDQAASNNQGAKAPRNSPTPCFCWSQEGTPRGSWDPWDSNRGIAPRDTATGPEHLSREQCQDGPPRSTEDRLTTQWREEDEEEAAREQRQRERERQLQDQDKDKEDDGGHSLEQPGQQTLISLKSSELDEDEGFGDWSQKPEPRQQFWGNEGTAEGTEPSQSERPEEKQTEESSHQANVHLEESNLSYREPDPEDAVGGSGEAEEHLIRHQVRTPSPLALEDTVELSSPPLSPTTKLADRTESLNRSIKKSNSVKKSQPTLPISTIDERLQQYTQATESSGRTPKLSRQPSIELPSMAVASTKTRWETGEVQSQSASKTPSCQDIVAGDMSKKSLWEQKGGSKISSTIKSTPSGKRYKFVATGHGKYEKVLVDEGSAP